jgi:hypothetical protein
MIQGALREVRGEIPPFAGPALLTGVAATLVLVVVMLISPAAGVAGGLVVFSFFLLALASFPARAAWQEGTGWRHGEPEQRQLAAQVLSAAIAVFFLVCAAAATVWALGAHLAAAAATFAICLVGAAVLGRHFQHTGWVEETRRAYGHVGWGPKLALAIVWLAVMTPEAISAFDHEEIRAGRVWEPAIRTLLAILPLGWLLWESRLLRASPAPRQAQARPPTPAA